MNKAYRYRLFPNEEQRVLIEKHFGCTRFVYNYALYKRIETYKLEGKTIPRFDLQAELPKLKKQEETCWLKEVNSHSLQASLINLDCAYVKFFREKKGFPKFKSKHVGNQSFQIPPSTTTKIDFENKKVRLPKFKEGIKFDAHREFVGEVKTCTISRTPTNKYYISILVEDGNELPTKADMSEETTIGIDLGLSHFLTTNRGEKIDNPRYLKNKLKALKRSQRNLSRKKKGSNNYKKQKLRLAKKHEKVTNERRDFHHKVSATLVRDNQTNTLVMENLDIKSMQKNRWLSQSISDVGWGEFVSMIKYKCDWYGKNFIQIGQYEPSSKLCSCGKINHELKLSDRIWTCHHCNTTHDRDILASNNIKQIGMGQPEFMPVEQDYSFAMKQETPRSLVER
jgi:putative transposase